MRKILYIFSLNFVKFVKHAFKMDRQLLFDAFHKLYESKLSNTKSRRDTFNEASAEYRDKFGFDPYKDVDSFMSSRSRKKKARR
jgi:hypothetical protein